MHLRMWKIEAANENVAPLVMQSHSHGGKRSPRQPGAVQCSGSRLGNTRLALHPLERRNQRTCPPFRHE